MMGQCLKSSTKQRIFCRLANQSSTTPLAHANETSEHFIFRLNSYPLLYLLVISALSESSLESFMFIRLEIVHHTYKWF